MLDIHNISVWDFFDNASKEGTDESIKTNRFTLGMAMSARAPGGSVKSNQKTEKRQSHQLQELFKNDMINTNVLPKVKND